MIPPTAGPSSWGANRSPAYATETAVMPGTSAPCKARSATRAANPGANAHASVATASAAVAPAITRRRPRASESGPYALDVAAIARTTAETVSPARAGPTPNSRESSGRTGCVTYMSAYAATVPA